jgi:hypothetical protein
MYVVYYASMLRCWQLVWILVKTNHPFLRVGHHMHVHDDLRHDGSSTAARADTLGRDLGDACHGLHLMPTRRRHIAVEDPGVPPSSEAPSCFSEPRLPTIPAMASATAMEWEDAEPKMQSRRCWSCENPTLVSLLPIPPASRSSSTSAWLRSPLTSTSAPPSPTPVSSHPSRSLSLPISAQALV